MRLPLSGGSLLVWGSAYTPAFGRQELELLAAVGSLADLALERVRTATRDAELAAVVDASGDAIVSTGLDGTIRLEDLTEEQRENLHYILSAARHLLELINEVLDIASIEAERLALSLEPVAVADVVAETTSLIRPWPTSTRCCWSARRWPARSTCSGTASGSSRSCSTCSPTPSSTTARAAPCSWSAAPGPRGGCG